MRVLTRRWGRISFLLTTLLLTGCNSSGPGDTAGTEPAIPPMQAADRSAGAFAQTDPWLLTTTDLKANRGNHGIFLGNGYVGATFGAGNGDEKEAVCYVAGVYDEKENLKPFPLWQNIGLPNAKSGDKYTQTLDMKRGILTTQIGAVTVTALAPLRSPNQFVLHVAGGPPPNTPPPTTTIGGVTFSVQDHTEADGSWTRVASFLPANAATDQKIPATWDGWVTAQENAWQARWKSADIQIDGDPEAQQLVHKLMFDLLQSVRPGGSDSIAPETLSGDFYKGHIFWDAEVWMFPALLAQHPDLARDLLDYRFRHLEQARAQAKAQGCAGVDFPWESAASGKEVAPGGFQQGRHVTAGVGWAVWQYWLATGDKSWMAERGWPLLSGVADYFATRAKKNAQTGKYEITKVFGPDELKGTVDNNTYTNAMARFVLKAATEAAKVVGKPANGQWAQVAENLTFPFDKTKGVYLTRQGDNGKPGTKQADGEMVLYPAELPMDAKTAAATFTFQAARPIKNGPAMTDSVHALIAARLGQKAEAEKAFRDSYRPFMRGPFLLFSEKRSLDRCVFTTGAGGVLQSVLYGFGGLSYTSPEGLVKSPVTLPDSWKKLAVTGIYRAGKRYTLTVTPQGRTLTAEK